MLNYSSLSSARRFFRRNHCYILLLLLLLLRYGLLAFSHVVPTQKASSKYWISALCISAFSRAKNISREYVAAVYVHNDQKHGYSGFMLHISMGNASSHSN